MYFGGFFNASKRFFYFTLFIILCLVSYDGIQVNILKCRSRYSLRQSSLWRNILQLCCRTHKELTCKRHPRHQADSWIRVLRLKLNKQKDKCRERTSINNSLFFAALQF